MSRRASKKSDPLAEQAVLLTKLKMINTRMRIIKSFAIQVTESTKQTDIESRSKSLNALYADYEIIVSEISEYGDGIARLDEFEECIDIIENMYHEIKSILNITEDNGENLKEKNIDQKHQSFKLPELSIPNFDGKPIEWLTFKETYIAVVHSNDHIKNVIKFTYLLDKLKGEAKQTIGHIVLTESGYEKAWQDLLNRYDNPRHIIEIHVDAIMNLPCTHKDNSLELRKLLNECNSNISSLEALNQKIDGLGELFIVNSVTKKLDPGLRKDWEAQLVGNELPSWKQLQQFLTTKCRILESIDGNKKPLNTFTNNNYSGSFNQFRSKPKQSPVGTAFVLSDTSDKKSHTTTKPSKSCAICNDSFHPFFVCDEFMKYTVQERSKKVDELKLCRNCFGYNHFSKDCRRMGCKKCNKKHNTLLHYQQTNHQQTSNKNPDLVNQYDPNVQNNGITCYTQQGAKGTLFPTAIVLVMGKQCGWQECRVLLDSASDMNFVSKKFADKFELQPYVTKQVLIKSINDQQTTSHKVVRANIKSLHSQFERELKCSIVPVIVDRLPQSKIKMSKWSIPTNIKLADPNFYLPRDIDMLIGNEIFFELLKSNQIRLRPNYPLLQESQLGWLIVGPYVTESSHNFTTISCQDSCDEENLEGLVSKFWELETIPDKPILSKEEQFCENHFAANYKRSETGRYIVTIPLNQKIKMLGDSKSQALKRYTYLEQRMNRDINLKIPYSEFMQEYETLGHMKKIDENCNNSTDKTYYLPHHGVLKPSSSTTKLRVVFDASAKSTSNIALNETMYIGPSVQDNLFNLIIRFRKHQYVMTADISKMYRQIRLDPEQTKLHRILWRPNPTGPVMTYELQTVTYGTASAPYLATRALKQLTIDEYDNHPIAARVAQRDFYVDDILTGASTITELLNLQSELTKLLNRGQFKLHKWCSNCEQLLNIIPMNDRETLRLNEGSSQEFMKTLGLIWKPKADLFCFNVVAIKIDAIITKRTILSNVAKIFDPLGLLSPIVITAKLLVQQLWNLKCDWDKEVPCDIANYWQAFCQQLPTINTININRGVVPKNPIVIELHGFSDASEKAYGACIYIRSIDSSNKVHANLLCSKSRVAPLRVLSLPRLELSAALLLSKLMQTVLEAIDVDFDKVVLWSDSTIVLQWIQTSPHRLKTFVANRVCEIQDLTNKFEWRYVPTENNAADVISRGVFPKVLQELHDWWNGPNFIQANNEYVTKDPPQLQNTDMLEMKTDTSKETQCFVSHYSSFEAFKSYSTLTRLKRIVAWCLRFCQNCKETSNRNTNSVLSAYELENAFLNLIRIAQHESFNLDMRHLAEGKDLDRQSKLKNLNPFLDDSGLLRVGGRIMHSELDYDIKHQLILPSGHPLTILIFRKEHLDNYHPGPQLLLSIVRQRIWAIKAKSIAKHTVYKCVICAKMKPRICSQIMGNLPPERLKPAKPFHTTGVDLCGPFQIKFKHQRKGSYQKIYVASFICFVTKAIHLELVSDLTAESFLACLKRFIYRRGYCKTIWSDNATNFVGCNNELQRQKKLCLNQCNDKIINYCSNQGIEWKFIPPRAPNFGGLWESSVRSFKHHLRRATSGLILNYEEFNTFIIQIEGILNSRPITPMSSDPSDPEPLTPGHFLTGGVITAIPEQSYIETPDNRLSSWKRISKVIESFWKRFSLEYIHTLQQRTKWQSSSPNLISDDIVLVLDELAYPTQWNLGRIINPIPGTDGKVRVVDVKVRGVIFRRPVSKICKLPIEREH